MIQTFTSSFSGCLKMETWGLFGSASPSGLVTFGPNILIVDLGEHPQLLLKVTAEILKCQTVNNRCDVHNGLSHFSLTIDFNITPLWISVRILKRSQAQE